MASRGKVPSCVLPLLLAKVFHTLLELIFAAAAPRGQQPEDLRSDDLQLHQRTGNLQISCARSTHDAEHSLLGSTREKV